ncbi:DUF1552 domain-containing protein [Humisphaera borealis]|uniref:DUF1552 domain-containing protein n=1 Tax=Humisphaera borealis TaxID=2807512 RepID=UPI0019D1F750|nr:DUF1552 domain-containing protein [Humisphaera borealis]
MPIAITKKHLSRRSFLSAAGVSLALPWFDAMLPALATPAQAAAATNAPRRFVAINHGLGIHTPFLVPKETGRDYTLTPYLEPLKDLRSDFTVFSGLSHPEQNGANGHTSELTILTSAKHPGLPGFKNSISFDQYLIEKLTPDTRFPYLTLNASGNGDSISWSGSGVNIPADGSPSKLFQRLFVNGTPSEVKQQMREVQRGRSILDTVNGRAKTLSSKLGGRDREKFDQYLTSVRELEGRLQASEGWVNKPKPQVAIKAPTDIPDRTEIIGRARLMNEMIVLALQTDSTRFITLKTAGGGEVPKIAGVDTGWHDLSHHGQDEQKIEELSLIEKAEFQEHANLLKSLKTAKDANGSVLDTTTVFITSNLGSASSHSWRDLPVLVAGGGYKHAGHVAAGGKGNDNARLCNLFVAMARKMGVDTNQFGTNDGTGVKGFEV